MKKITLENVMKNGVLTLHDPELKRTFVLSFDAKNSCYQVIVSEIEYCKTSLPCSITHTQIANEKNGELKESFYFEFSFNDDKYTMIVTINYKKEGSIKTGTLHLINMEPISIPDKLWDARFNGCDPILTKSVLHLVNESQLKQGLCKYFGTLTTNRIKNYKDSSAIELADGGTITRSSFVYELLKHGRAYDKDCEVK